MTATAPRRPARSRRVVIGALILAAACGAWFGSAFASRARADHVAFLARLDAAHSGEPEIRTRSRQQLIADPAAAERLAAVIRRGGTRWHAQFLPWIETLPGLDRVRELQGKRERVAVEVLQRTGVDAASAVLPLLGQPRYGGRDTAIALLRAWGTHSIPHLVRTLSEAGPDVRAGAVVALAKFPSRDLDDLAPLRRARTDPAVQVRLAAVWGLGQMRDRPDLVVPELVASLDDESDQVRLEAIKTLRPFASQATNAVDVLRRRLSDASAANRGEAAVTLAMLGRAAATAREDLLRTMRGNGPGFREAASAVLLISTDDGPESPEAFERLRSGLRSRDIDVRIRTVELLGTLGPRARSVVPELLPFLENEESRDDRPTLTALRAIQPDAIPERFRRRGQGRP